MPGFDKVVIVTRKTALDELVERFNTRDQARFYIEHMGGSFDDYQAAHDTYRGALEMLKGSIPRGVRVQWIDRSFLPTFTFGEGDLVVTLGPDGLVVNTAKYLHSQPLIALNPDPARIDGVLVPFAATQAGVVFRQVMEGNPLIRRITMAKADLNDGQTLLAVNDLFIGQKTHISARYRLVFGGREEDQASSGIIVSTGAGSTGWFRSIVTGASGLMENFSSDEEVRSAKERYRFDWEAESLVFSVREPFVSKTSGADLVYGRITAETPLAVVSRMPQKGVIFSDGIEEDFLQFNSGAIARIGLADRKLHLVVPLGAPDR